MNNSISWTSEQLNKQLERVKSDMEFINEGAVYTFDEGAQKPRLDISSDKSAIVHVELITIGEVVELGASFYCHILRKIENTHPNIHVVGFLPTDEYIQNVIPEFIEKFGIITLYGRNFFAQKHCNECSRSYLYEMSENDKRILEEACKGKDSREKRAQIREVAKRVTQIEFMSKEFLDRLANEMAKRISAYVIAEKKKEDEYQERCKQEEIRNKERERIRKEKQEEKDKLRKEREELEQLGPLV